MQPTFWNIFRKSPSTCVLSANSPIFSSMDTRSPSQEAPLKLQKTDSKSLRVAGLKNHVSGKIRFKISSAYVAQTGSYLYHRRSKNNDFDTFWRGSFFRRNGSHRTHSINTPARLGSVTVHNHRLPPNTASLSDALSAGKNTNVSNELCQCTLIKNGPLPPSFTALLACSIR